MAFKFPSLAQWKQIFKVLKKSEKITLLVFFILAGGSLFFLSVSFYFSHTHTVPAFGGTFVEGVIGQPRFINPIYGETNDIDRALIDLVFSGLMTYDKDGLIINDLAENIEISDGGKTYTFTLKDNIFWHDQRPLTSDDVIFTIKTIQNSDYKSPLRANWIDVEVEKISGKQLAFHLKRAYSSFLENCTVKIIPQHIWENVLAENFALSLYNLQPIGSGPFQFINLSQSNTGFIETLHLESNRKYYRKASFISNIIFTFFEKTEDLLKAAKSKSIDGFALTPIDKSTSDIENELTQRWSNILPTNKDKRFSLYSFALPRYFAVFFNNQKTSIFSDANIRKALIYSTNKPELVQKINQQAGDTISIIDSPILPDFYGFNKPSSTFEFDVKKANDLLDKTGFKVNAEGLREKITTKKPAFEFKSYLKLNSKGTEVTQLQGCLSHLTPFDTAQGKQNFTELLKDEVNGTYGKGTENAVNEFQKQYLPEQKPTGETGPSTRKKLNELCAAPTENSEFLQFTLVTINQPQLVETANALKNYWEALGVSVQINAVNITDLKPLIKDRNYDALLYGETLGMMPDLYPFWYSSQKQDPGLNLSSYESKDADKLLKEARETIDQIQKQQSYEELQDIILQDAPALFLYNPEYVYWASQLVSGIDTVKIADPAKRFSNITNWFITTKRTWK